MTQTGIQAKQQQKDSHLSDQVNPWKGLAEGNVIHTHKKKRYF